MNTERELFIDLFFQLLPLFNKKLAPIFQDARREFGLKKNQIRVLMIIKHREKTTATVLGELLDLKKGSLTTLVDSLESKNYVTRVIDKSDRRKHWLILTEEGLNQCIAIDKFVGEKFYAKISHISKDSLGEYSEVLKKLIELMEIM